MTDIILYTTEDGQSQIKLRAKDETVWQTKREMSQLFDVSTDNVGLLLKNIFDGGGLSREATTEDSSVTQTAGAKDIGRAFSPWVIVSTGFLGRCPRLVWRWAFGPETQVTPRSRFHASIVTFGPETQIAPTARLHTSLGQGPRYGTPKPIEG